MWPSDVSSAASDALARIIKKFVDVELDPKSEPKRNPYGSNWIRQRDLDRLAVPIWGRVVDALAYAGVYKVQLENESVLWCTLGGLTGFQPYGARQINTLPMGTAVYCLLHPGAFIGTIIAAEPDYITHPKNHRSDFITQTSRCGPGVDSMHAAAYRLRMQGGAGQFPGGRPADGLPVGEWGAISEAGLMSFLDSFMVNMRVDEETGLFLWYRDQLARLTGHNLQIRSAVRELDDWNDENELASIDRYSVYLREKYGAFDISGSPAASPNFHRDFTSSETFTQVPEYANREPYYDDQQSYHRFMRFHGYLGQGFYEVLSIPPDDATDTTVNRYQTQSQLVGVYEQHASMHGGWGVRSAKRIMISKGCISVPKQMKLPEDKNGDSRLDYKAGDEFGSGVAHEIIDGIDTAIGETTPKHILAAAQILDMGAFAFNWEPLHTFFYHTKDWYLPEACDTGSCVEEVSFCSLRSAQNLYPPSPIVRDVDHRYSRSGGVSFYPTQSDITMLEDGGVVIGDGYGAELKLTGGQIFISAPGDVWLQSGRNLNLWAGWDFIAKGYNSFDISATRKDGRVKAEGMLWMVGGNDTYGGVVIESKAADIFYQFNEDGGEQNIVSGIVLKADNSKILAYSREIFLRVEDTGSGDEADGTITLDARNDKIRMYCDYMERFLGQAAMDFFGSDGTITNTNEYWADSANIGSQLYVAGQGTFDGCLTVNDWIRIASGHIAGANASTYSFQVVDLTGAPLTNATGVLTNGSDRQIDLISIGADEYLQDELTNIESMKDDIAFSFRTSDEQRVFGDWFLMENRWQQLARLYGQDVSYWVEKPVLYNGNETWPYPGPTAISGANTFRLTSPALFDTSTGCPEARGSVYETATYDETQPQVIGVNYPILMDQ